LNIAIKAVGILSNLGIFRAAQQLVTSFSNELVAGISKLEGSL
jgi:hypothetical protein